MQFRSWGPHSFCLKFVGFLDCSTAPSDILSWASGWSLKQRFRRSCQVHLCAIGGTFAKGSLLGLSVDCPLQLPELHEHPA